MHRGVLSNSAAAVPDCVLVDFYETKGTTPTARWGHTAVAVNDKLYVFGGDGDQVLEDLHVFQPGDCHWLTYKVSAVNGPSVMHGHAACNVGNQIFMYGGRHGRKVLQGLYRFCTDTMKWQACGDGNTKPPALTAHTLTAVGQHGILCFGGQGKKIYNAVHKLDPASCVWLPFKTIGIPPSPRHGHTAVWDTSDSLVVFGGINSNSQCLADVHILSLSTGYWSSPQCTGILPRPRANHAAVMWGSSLMLVFGGCDPKAAGRFMNDVLVLDLLTFTWHCLHIMGTPPAPRYWHTMTMLQGQAVVYGGSNAVRSFDRLFSISSDWTRELEVVAAEMGHMSAGSNGRTSAPSARHMQRQLDGMLQQQALAEALVAEQQRHSNTLKLLEDGRQKLQAATAEVAKLQLLQDEQQAKYQQRTNDLCQELSRLQQTHQRCRFDLQTCKQDNQELNKLVKDQEVQCTTLRQVELRCQDLQQQCRSLQQQYMSLQQQHSVLQQQHTALQQDDESLQQSMRQLHEELHHTRNRLKSHQEADSIAQQQPKPSRVFAVQASSRILDTCNADDTCVQQTGSAITEADFERANVVRCKTVKSDGKLGDMPQLCHQLIASLNDNTSDHDQLMTSTLSELHSAESGLEDALRKIRHAARSSSEGEVSRSSAAVRQMEQLLEQYRICSLCMERDQQVVLNCGHLLCSACSDSVGSCPFCRTPVHMRTKVYRA